MNSIWRTESTDTERASRCQVWDRTPSVAQPLSHASWLSAVIAIPDGSRSHIGCASAEDRLTWWLAQCCCRNAACVSRGLYTVLLKQCMKLNLVTHWHKYGVHPHSFTIIFPVSSRNTANINTSTPKLPNVLVHPWTSIKCRKVIINSAHRKSLQDLQAAYRPTAILTGMQLKFTVNELFCYAENVYR
jgi:hypothetical protein